MADTCEAQEVSQRFQVFKFPKVVRHGLRSPKCNRGRSPGGVLRCVLLSGIPHVKSSDGVDDTSISPDRPLACTVATDSGSVSSF